MVLLAAIVLIVGINAFLLVPIVVVAVISLMWAPIIAAIAGRTGTVGGAPGRGEPTGVPSTREASYDPQMRPEDRPSGTA
jgi:hypothetical protein